MKSSSKRFVPEIYARLCDKTKKGMNEGYYCEEPELYFSEKQYLIEHLRSICTENLSDEELLNKFYNDDYYYYSTWDPKENDPDEGFYLHNGTHVVRQVLESDNNEYEVIHHFNESDGSFNIHIHRHSKLTDAYKGHFVYSGMLKPQTFKLSEVTRLSYE
jgi:hypothetical protein